MKAASLYLADAFITNDGRLRPLKAEGLAILSLLISCDEGSGTIQWHESFIPEYPRKSGSQIIISARSSSRSIFFNFRHFSAL